MTAALAPDRAVPHRDELLDTGGVAAVIGERLCRNGARPTRCERMRATYRVGESLRVLYRVEVGGAIFHVAARTFAEDRLAAIQERLVHAAIPTGPLRPAAAVPELGAVFWTYPNDRKLKTLGLLPAAAAEILRRPVGSVELVSYAPEKSATAQCLADDGTRLAYAKVYGDDTRTSELAERLSLDGAAPRVPRVLGYASDARTLVVEPLEGTPLAASADPTAYHAFGRALATLHELRPLQGAPRFVRTEPQRLDRAAEQVAAARPDVAAEVRDLARLLESRRPRDPDTPSLLHGDPHPKNALVANGQVALIDLDQLAVGAAAAEVGGALAGLEYRRITGAGVDGLDGALLSGYAAVRQAPADDVLGWHVAAALLVERILRAVARVRPEGLARLRPLVERADELAEPR